MLHELTMKKMLIILLTLLIIYSAILAFFYFIQSGLLFYPQPLAYQVPTNKNIEEITITTQDDKNLHGWLSKSQSEQPYKLIIYFGGNAEEVSHMLLQAPIIGDWAMLLINYPGYGKSEGKPGEKSFFKSALEIYDYAVSRDDIDKDNIVLMGRSIGTGSAVFLAQERKAKAVVLISPFESIKAVAQSSMPFLPVGLLLKHKFESKKYAGNIAAPMLAFYGTNDHIIPPKHSKKLMEYWKGEAQLIKLPGYGHNDIFQSTQLWEETNKFLNSLP